MSVDETVETGLSSEYSLIPFFKLSSDLLCIAGYDGYFKKINPALSKLLGYSKEELLASPINSFIHPEDQKLTEKHRDNIRQGKPLLNFENRYLTKDGKTVWLSWTSIPHNEKQLVYAVAKDITHRKKHEKQRNKLVSELTQSNQRLKQLTYTTSHDLRTPVNNLLSVFNLIDTSNIQNEETLELIDLLKDASKNLKKTLDNYVDDLNQDDTLHISTTELNIHEVLDSVIQSIHSFIRDSNTTFQINLDDFDTITFNRAYLESIFLNLVTNSIKYAHPDRNPVISVNAKNNDGDKQLIFSDNARGFDSEKLKGKVFGLHQKFHNHEDSKGIGLYLVYNHITNLGGKISVESKVDEGTTFILTFID
jgi:PAS domain S-box-containing protein